MIVAADHSHAPVERRIDLPGAFSDFAVAGPRSTAADDDARSRCAPRSARDGLRPRAGGPRASSSRGSSDRARDARASTSSPGATTTDGARSPPTAASCASPPAATSGTRAGIAGTSTGDLGALGAAAATATFASARLPRRAAALLGRADLRDVRRRPAQRGARLGVPGLGRRRPRRRRQPRLAAPQRLARRARSAAWGAPPGTRAPGRSPTSRRWSAAILRRSVPSRAVTDEAATVSRPRRSHARVRLGLRHRQQLGGARALRAVGASGYVVNLAVFTALVHWTSTSGTRGRRRAFVRRGAQQLLLEPPLDLRGPRRPRRLPGRALLRRQRGGLRRQPGRPGAAGRRGGLNEVLAQAIAIVVATPCNFLGNKLWTFAADGGASCSSRSSWRAAAVLRCRPDRDPDGRPAGSRRGDGRHGCDHDGGPRRPPSHRSPKVPPTGTRSRAWVISTGSRADTSARARRFRRSPTRCRDQAPSARSSRAPTRTSSQGPRPLAGLLLRADQAAQGDRPGPDRRHTRVPSSSPTRATGRVDHGPRLRRRVRRKVNSPWVWIPLTVLFVAPFLQPAPPAADAAPRPARARRLRLPRWRSSTTRKIDSASRSSHRCSSTCSCACCGSACAARDDPGCDRPLPAAGPGHVAGGRGGLPARASASG